MIDFYKIFYRKRIVTRIVTGIHKPPKDLF